MSCVYDFVDRCVCHVCMTLLTGVCVSCVYDFVDRCVCVMCV